MSNTPQSMASSSEQAAVRRYQLRDKMILQILRQHKKAHPDHEVDQKIIDVMRHQLGEMLLIGPVDQTDLARLAKMLSKSVAASVQSSQKGSKVHSKTGSKATASKASTNRDGDMRSTHVSVVSAPARLNEDDQDQDHEAVAGSTVGSGGVSPYAPIGQIPDDPETLHSLAQQVRSLPPLVQKKMLLSMSTGPWYEHMKKGIEEEKKRTAEEKLKQMQLKQEQREYLDLQVKRREQNRMLEKQASLQQAVEEAQQREVWKESVRDAAQKRKEATVAVQQDLQQQRAEALKRKAEEAERLRLEDARKAEQLRQEVEKEELEKKQKRERMRGEIKNFLAFNEVMKARKEEEKKKLAEMDVKLMEQYNERMEKQEAEHRAYLQIMYDKQRKQYKMAELHHESLQALIKADEDKALKEQARVEEKRLKEEEAKREKQRIETMKMKIVVENQIREKEERKRIQREETIRLKEEMERNARLAEQKEILRRQQAKQFALQGLRDIDRQLVELHERRFQPPQMKVGERPR